MPTWDSGQYLRFADERTRPCHDLSNRVALANPRRIIDLGCGPGNSTRVLTERWPEPEIEGLDSSPEMIATARKSFPTGRWTVGDIATWKSEAPHDLIFSNAALHWLPDHGQLFQRLAGEVAPGGVLAAQMPANGDAPAHRLMRELAGSARWRKFFPAKVREWFVHEPDFYYETLTTRMKRIDIWTTNYVHVMESVRAIVEWYKGTGLRPFLDVLPGEEHGRLLADYETLLQEAFPMRSDGKVLFPFLRLFVVGYRG